MARIRTIKPEFFTSEDIVSLSPLARLLYQATWCEADKEGRLVWKPRTFKLRYFPGDNCDIEAMCQELVDSGLVVLYGDGLAYIPTFSKHQHINPRESASTLPDPDQIESEKARVNDASARVSDGESTVSDAQGGREGKGRSIGADAPAAPANLTLQDLVAEGINKQHASDWLKVRKAKRAPLTQTAWESLKTESLKAGISAAKAVEICAKRNWQGFNASWEWKDASSRPQDDIWAGAK